MVYKPSTNELECIRVRVDKIGNLFFRKISAISETERDM